MDRKEAVRRYKETPRPAGATGFVFEVVDLLDEPDSPTEDITRDLDALHELWREKLLSDSTPTS